MTLICCETSSPTIVGLDYLTTSLRVSPCKSVMAHKRTKRTVTGGKKGMMWRKNRNEISVRVISCNYSAHRHIRNETNERTKTHPPNRKPAPRTQHTQTHNRKIVYAPRWRKACDVYVLLYSICIPYIYRKMLTRLRL